MLQLGLPVPGDTRSGNRRYRVAEVTSQLGVQACITYVLISLSSSIVAFRPRSVAAFERPGSIFSRFSLLLLPFGCRFKTPLHLARHSIVFSFIKNTFNYFLIIVALTILSLNAVISSLHSDLNTV